MSEEDSNLRNTCHFCSKSDENIKLIPVCSECSTKSSKFNIPEISYSYDSYQNLVPSSSIEEISAAISQSQNEDDFVNEI